MLKYLDVTDLKRIETHLLHALGQFCQEHNLRYFLTYGTLIGAIRHQGFIPWDDDIDVMMPRKDYEYLVANFNRNRPAANVSVLSHSIDKRYYLPLAKLVDTTTVLKEDVTSDYEIGVYLDIFPLDNLSDDFEEARARIAKAFRYNRMLLIKTATWRKGRALVKNLALVAGKVLLSTTSVSRLLEKMDRFCREKESDTFTQYVGVMAGISGGDDSRVFRREWFEQEMIVTFEGAKYPAPVGADDLLRKIYGDYMQLPPEDCRVSHHSFEAWMKE